MMKKQITRIFSLALTVTLMMGVLCIQASAASVTIERENYSIVFSDVVSEQEFKNEYDYPVKVYTVQTGTTLTGTDNDGDPVCFLFLPASLENGVLKEPESMEGYYESDEGDGTITTTLDKPGLWTACMNVTYMGNSNSVLEATILVEGTAAPTGGTETPVTPTTPEQPTAPTTPEQPTAPVAPAAPGSYTVKKGDTMGQIAVNYYGSYGSHKALYQANAEAFKATGGKLTPGMVLTLPEKLGNAVRISAPVAGAGESLYTVKAGDTLGAIAKATYGDVMQYKAIFERNNDRLKNANTIYEGQVIVLPAK